MTETPWERMSADEKLNWLRAKLDHFGRIGDKNATTLDGRFSEIIGRLTAVEDALHRILQKGAA